MSLRASDDLSAHLPFAVDDYAAAGGAFAAWRASGSEPDKQTVDLWAYCYVLRTVTRYFLNERGTPSDLDAVVSRAYDGVQKAAASLQDPHKFPHYVSVVCRNALLSHRERRRPTVEADDATLGGVPADEYHAHDAVVVRRAVEEAITELPAAIRETARMRLLDRRSYDDIAEATGHPLATVRTYHSKAVARLRGSPVLRAHFYDDVLPPGALGMDAAVPRAPGASRPASRPSTNGHVSGMRHPDSVDG